MSIEQNWQQVQERVRAACARGRRQASDVTVLAVSKLQPLEKIRQACHAGVRTLAENYVQELLQKQAELQELGSLEWHLIGPLQTNKVKQVVGKVRMIHTLDRMELAKEISKRATAAGCTQSVLVQVNIAEEDSKSGVSVEGLRELLLEASKLPGIRVEGLMTMPPLQSEPEQNRTHFRRLRQLANEAQQWSNLELKVLSMGTSHDFEVAIEEGATHVRIGTTIFGERGK